MNYKMRIKFDNREWLVIDNIEYENVKYYYIIEDVSDKINHLENLNDYDGKIKMEFIYKLDNGNYRNVTDKKIINILLAIVGKKNILKAED